MTGKNFKILQQFILQLWRLKAGLPTFVAVSLHSGSL